MSAEPLKLNIIVQVLGGTYEGAFYQFESKKSLTEHTLKEVKARLERATEEVVEELRHSSFLKTHLAERQLACLNAQDKLQETHKKIEAKHEEAPF